MKTASWILCCILLSSCSIFRKSVNSQKQEVKKYSLFTNDSLGRLTIDTGSVSRSTGWAITSVDSGYDKVTEEVIIGYTDSIMIRRTIKEKGQKRVEQSTSITRYDSAGKKSEQASEVKQLQKVDSSASAVTTKKEVARSSFLPWWIWLILAVALALGWWKRNPILEFFKS